VPPVIAVLVPALGRPERVAPFRESWESASRVEGSLLWIVSPGDEATMAACAVAGVSCVEATFPLAGGDYARKINLGVDLTLEPWVFQAGDDLRFHDGWDEEALRIGQSNPAAYVVGTNDLGNPLVKAGKHATHSLIARDYIEEQGTIDEPGKALHEGYWHCWVDNELIETAKARRAYWAARRSKVEHLHHIWRKGRNDATYRRGQERYHEDHLLFLERRPLWQARSVRRSL
jgi:hypothetical protein